jgi:hypothetical protein
MEASGSHRAPAVYFRLRHAGTNLNICLDKPQSRSRPFEEEENLSVQPASQSARRRHHIGSLAVAT